MSQKTKRYLMLLMAIGLVAIAAGGGSGTFASFSAQTVNPNNFLATGTLFLHATKQGGTVCTSEADATDNHNILTTNGCDTLFNISNLGTNVISPVNLQLDNAGSIDATALKFSLVSACSDSKPTITTTTGAVSSGAQTTIAVNALPQILVKGTQITIDDGVSAPENMIVNTTTLPNAISIDVTGSTLTNGFNSGAKIQITATFGSANLCSNLKFVIQEKNAGWATDQKCVFGGGTGASCVFGAQTLGGVGTTLNDLTASLWNGGTNAGALDAGESRYFTIEIQSPASFLNAQQNAAASFDLKWDIEQ